MEVVKTSSHGCGEEIDHLPEGQKEELGAACKLEEYKNGKVVKTDNVLEILKQKISVARKREAQNLKHLADLGFAYVGRSKLTFWHRPTKAQILLFKELYGLTMIVTAQSPSEKPSEILRMCEELSLNHVHIKLNGANKAFLGDRKIQKYLCAEIQVLFRTMCSETHTVMLHCAAGIHRTGVVGYSLLRLSGLERDEVIDVMQHIRPVTRQGVAEWRIDLAEECVVASVKK